MNKQILSVCSRTLLHFRKILKETQHKNILVGVRGGGCNGLKYYVEPTSNPPDKFDEQLKIDDVNIIICGKSLIYLLGTEIKWTTDYMSSGMEFINPNASSSCGCGETFSL